MSEDQSPTEDPLEDAAERLDKVDEGDDEERLKALEDLNSTLEKELDRDVDEAGPPRH